ncbi:hybrid sensor histidine kinase/response regulator [Methanogenium organophilum]|uniref:histidine kinase n=1 Tax=Methanogenium organophilum TaxID=2199 RepID=A0A9X9S6S2_METOG|nr:PAS domain S-box protein [Methanogenium organophilum]WAI02445.1 PAS domain S-box protein [Methanogenium organophilum]
MKSMQETDGPILVLYVDDEPALLEIGKIYLERADGIHVTTVDNPEDAIRLLVRDKFDAIVSDYQMPGMDGIAFLKYIRRTYGDLPFLLFTGKGREEIVIEALNNGADYYVEKAGLPEPQFADLVHKIRRAVSRCRTDQILRNTYNELRCSSEQLAIYSEELNIREEKIVEMEQALRESEQIYKAIFANTGSATAILEEDMTISLVNAAFAKLAGFSREEIEGCIKWSRFVHPDDRARLEEYHRARRRVSEHVPEHYEFRFLDRFGSERLIYMTIGLIPGTLRSVASHTDITELKEIRSRLSLFGNILDDSLNEIYIFDTTTLRFVHVNRGGRENLGYSMDELRSLTPVDLKPECTDVSFRELVAPLLSGEKDIVCFTTMHRRKDGTEYPIEAHVHLSHVVSPPVFVAVIIDITSRREAEEENQILRRMVDSAPSAITVHDYEGRFIYVNARTLAMHGYMRDEFMALTLDDLDVPASRAWIDTHFQEVRTAGETVFETEHYRKDGSILPLFVHLSVTQWGERTVLLSIAEDITEWRVIEHALRESRKQLSLALDAANDGLWDWNVSDGTAYFSPQYLRMLGYEPEEFATTYDVWWEFVHPDDRDGAESAIREALATQTDYYKEFRMRKKDGSYLWILARGRVMEMDDMGQPLRMVGTHVDISERKQVEEALRLANRKLQLLSGITRHDILNQAMALDGYLTLAEEMDPAPPLGECLQKMHRAAHSIERTIAFTREYEQLGRNEPNWISLRDAAADLLNCRELSVSFSCDGVAVFADPLLNKVFFNLMDNILRHGKHASAVTVICSLTETGGLAVILEDNGAGVPADLKEKIFEHKFGSNTGMGLFLVREILAITGITIYECGTEGEGARFELVVPPSGWRVVKNAAHPR